MRVVEPFHRERLPQHQRAVDGAVVEEDLYLFAQLLLPRLPEDGVAIHDEDAVACVVDHRVAHRLNVAAEGSHVVVGMNDAVGGVRVKVERKDLERVGMGIHRVLLAVVDADGTVGRHDVFGAVLVVAVFAGEHVLVDDIGVDHIAECLGCGGIVVPHHAVAHEPFAVVGQNAAVQQMRVVRLRVVVAQLGIDMVLAILYIGGAYDVCNGRQRVVVQRVGDKHRLRLGRRCGIDQPDIVVEDCFVGGRTVLSPVAGQLVALVEKPSALEEIAEVVETVVVEAVRVDGRGAVFEHDIISGTCQLVQAVVVEHFAVEHECVALVQEDMAEGIKGVCGFVEERAVAVEQRTVVAELYMAHQELCRAVLPLVEEETVGMQQVHLAVGRRSVLVGPPLRRYCHKQTKAEEQ